MYNDIIAVTNRHLCQRPFLEQIERVCSIHPKALLLREKDLSEEEYEALAREVLAICNAYQVPCILHFFPEVAKKLQVDAIHLPLWKLQECVSELTGFSQIGTSTHSPAEALKAQQLGATYVTAGHIYTTDCKKGLPPRGLDFLQNVCNAVTIPVYGIGGIKLSDRQINEVKSCGASGVCVMSGMMLL